MVATLRDKDVSDHDQKAGKGVKRLRGEERREVAGARLCEIAKKCHVSLRLLPSSIGNPSPGSVMASELNI